MANTRPTSIATDSSLPIYLIVLSIPGIINTPSIYIKKGVSLLKLAKSFNALFIVLTDDFLIDAPKVFRKKSFEKKEVPNCGFYRTNCKQKSPTTK
jgi:hypothetical protein